MTKIQNFSEEALATCDKEPIHIPGSIQNVGYLLAFDNELQEVQFYSENIEQLFPDIAQDNIVPKDIFTIETLHNIRNVIGHSTSITQRENVQSVVEIKGQHYDLSAHRSGESCVVEFLPSYNDASSFGALDQVRWIVDKMQSAMDVDSILKMAVEHLRSLTQYDRVMAYRFHPDDSGEVVAEARAPYADSYLGLRYPAWDIPKQAREIFRKIPIRLIADVQADTVPLIAKGSREPLDMTLAVLRGTSPVHLQYLANMGIRSSMSLPIVVKGKLWGLFAFHHYETVQPTQNISMASELAGRLLSLSIEQIIERQRATALGTSLQISNNLIGLEDSELSSSQYWLEIHGKLVDLLPADQLAYCIDDRTEFTGESISASLIGKLRALADTAPDGILAIDNLKVQFPDEHLGDIAGALVLSIAFQPRTHLIFFRRAISKSITWAGAPEKDIEQTKDGVKLNPRASFESYIQQVEDQSESWISDELLMAESLKEAMERAIQTREDLKKNRHRLGLMVSELNHRVRNILALIKSLSNQARESATSLEAYAEALEQRILALAGTHDMLVRENMDGVELAKLVVRELKPFLRQEELEDFIEGPPVIIRADIAPMVALVIHELTSNAVKHGSLTTRQGRVKIKWNFEKEGLQITWREENGPAVALPSRTGFGRALIEKSFAYEFDGTADIRFQETGLEADFWLPADTFVKDSIRSDAEDKKKDEKTETVIKPPKEIEGYALIVEDNFVLATDMATALKRAGFKDVDTAASVKQALSMIESRNYHFALLDINLRGEMSFEVADKLRACDTNFVFATGYGELPSIPKIHKSVEILTKPLRLEDVIRSIP